MHTALSRDENKWKEKYAEHIMACMLKCHNSKPFSSLLLQHELQNQGLQSNKLLAVPLQIHQCGTCYELGVGETHVDVLLKVSPGMVLFPANEAKPGL